MKRYVRSRARVIGALGQPTLFLQALGFRLGPTFGRAGRGDYVQFLAPGIVTMGILFTAVFSGIEIIWDRQFGFLKETLVAPVSRLKIVRGHTLGSATVALIEGSIVFLVCLAAGFRLAQPLLLPLALLFMALIAIMCAAIGTAVGSVFQGMQGFPLIRTSSCCRSSSFRAHSFRCRTCLEAVRLAAQPAQLWRRRLRGVLTSSFVLGVAADFAVLGGLAAILLAIGAYLFSKIEVAVDQMTNLVTSPEASMFGRPTAVYITTRKKLARAANAARDALMIPSQTTNKGASAIFGINWS